MRISDWSSDVCSSDLPQDDLISQFIVAEIDGEKMSRIEVIQMSILLLIGGVETTTNLLGTTLVELKRNPEVYARVRANSELIPALIEAVLRYNPPVQIILDRQSVVYGKSVAVRVDLGGCRIIKKKK